MRAVSEDKEAAELMGIDVDRIIVFTFAIGRCFCWDCWHPLHAIIPCGKLLYGFLPRD